MKHLASLISSHDARESEEPATPQKFRTAPNRGAKKLKEESPRRNENKMNTTAAGQGSWSVTPTRKRSPAHLLIVDFNRTKSPTGLSTKATTKLWQKE